MTSDQHEPAFANLVRDLTTRAGFTTDNDELDVTVAHEPDLIADWVRAAADHATCTHLRYLFDSPIEFLRSEVAASSLDGIDAHVHLLADLVERRQSLADQAARALTDLTAACHALSASGFMWPTHRIGPDQPTDMSQPPMDSPRHALVQALTELGLQPTPPAHPDTATYRHQREQRQITVLLTPPDDPSVIVHATSGDLASWTAQFSPGTPIPVLVAAIRAALGTGHRPPASDPRLDG